MKKWVIIIVVVMLGAALAIKHMQNKRAVPAPVVPEQPVETGVVGVALPSDATSYTSTVSETSEPERPYAAPEVTAQKLPEATCKATVKDVIREHNKVWGYGGKTFTLEETSELYRLWARYQACMGVASGNPSACDALPGGVESKKFKIAAGNSPRAKCKTMIDQVGFSAFMTGDVKGRDACLRFASSERMKFKSSSDFCAAAANGPQKLCEYINKVRPGSVAECYSIFPTDPKDCVGEGAEDCHGMYATMYAIKHNASSCPQDGGLCAAYISRTGAGCQTAAKELEALYCQYLSSPRSSAGLTEGDRAEAMNARIREGMRKMRLKRKGGSDEEE